MLPDISQVVHWTHCLWTHTSYLYTSSDV